MPTFKNEVTKANQVAIVGISKKHHGIAGESQADGAGVIGASDSGDGVSGFSKSGNGVVGQSARALQQSHMRRSSQDAQAGAYGFETSDEIGAPMGHWRLLEHCLDFARDFGGSGHKRNQVTSPLATLLLWWCVLLFWELGRWKGCPQDRVHIAIILYRKGGRLQPAANSLGPPQNPLPLLTRPHREFSAA